VLLQIFKSVIEHEMLSIAVHVISSSSLQISTK